MASRKRSSVELTACWGEDDASSTIKVSPSRWRAIQEGAGYTARAWSYYEGKRESVAWSFADGQVSIGGDDGRECVVDMPISDLLSDPATQSVTSFRKSVMSLRCVKDTSTLSGYHAKRLGRRALRLK